MSPQRFPAVKADAGLALEAFLLRRSTQERIAAFGRERFGRELFRPLGPGDAEGRADASRAERSGP